MALDIEGSHLNEKESQVGARAIECPTAIVDVPDDVHSVFTPLQKRLIVLAASTAALLSPLASNIYLPALNLIATDLRVSDSQINLTVTSYLIFQALSPMVVAGFSDNAGRRPAYIACFSLYMGANMALTVQHSYLGLLILRCFQSAGSSAMVALCQGIVADVATAADRGTYVAYASVSTILGPTLSPVIGGLLSQYFGWRAIFWFLAAFAAPVFALILLFLPETCHKIVGNGSIPSSSFYHMTLHEWFRGEKRLARDVGVSEEHEGLLTEKPSIKFPNPLTTLKILSNKEALLLMGFVGIVFGIHYLVLSTIPFRYGDMYEFGETQLGLIYVLRAGKRHAKRLDFPLSKEKQLDLTHFPIEQARLEIALPILYFSSAIIALYGLSLKWHTPIPGMLILLFCIGYGVYALYQITAILIIDLHPETPVTATAANNLVRCSFAAASTACAVPLVESFGAAQAYSLAAITAFLMSFVLWTLITHGPLWRRDLASKRDLRTALPDL